MKENEQSRYFRWGIPGWMMFLSFFGYSVIDIVFSQDSGGNKILSFILDILKNGGTSSPVSAAFIGLMIAVAGIPSGFLIYQLYFYVRWNSPFSRDGLFPPLVVGRWNDLDRTLRDITDDQLTAGEDWRRQWIANPEYKNDHSGRWRYVENYFIELVQKIDKESGELNLYPRYRYLLELLHTLGSGLFGLYLGYLGYLMLKVKIYTFSLTIMLIICALCLVVLIFLLEVEDKLRKSHMEDVRQDGLLNRVLIFIVDKWSFVKYINLSTIYLCFWGVFLYLGSPSPYDVIYTPEHLRFRIVVLLFPLLGWALANNSSTRRLRILEIVLLLFVGATAYLFSQSARIILFVDRWPFGWATFAFLIANAVLIKNRQNARDDLIAMQNYTLKRFLTPQSKPQPKKEKWLDFRLRI